MNGNDYVTKTELDKALRKQTDEIAEIVTSFMGHVDQRFNKLELRQDILEQKLDRGFAELNEKYDHLLNTIDGFLKRLDEIEVEQAARDHQFQRLLAWARKVSEKTGIPLENL